MQVRSDISVLVIYQIQRFWKKSNYIDQSLNRLLMQLRYDPLKSFISHLISIQIILNLKKNEFFNRSTHVWSIENNFKVIWTRLKLMNILILLFLIWQIQIFVQSFRPKCQWTHNFKSNTYMMFWIWYKIIWFHWLHFFSFIKIKIHQRRH